MKMTEQEQGQVDSQPLKKDSKLIYKQKCARIQQQMNEYLFANSTLEQKIRQQKHDLLKVRQEREFLLHRLLCFQSTLTLEEEKDVNKKTKKTKRKKINDNPKPKTILIADSNGCQSIHNLMTVMNGNVASSASFSVSSSSYLSNGTNLSSSMSSTSSPTLLDLRKSVSDSLF